MENKNKNKKIKGIKGRSSDSQIDFRMDVCKDLLKTTPFTSKREFFILYKKALINKGLTILPTKQTLYKDIKKLNYDFKKGVGFINLSEYSSNYRIMVSTIKNYIKQIRISCFNYEKKLFDINNLPNKYNVNTFSSYVDNYKYLIKNANIILPEQLNESITHLYIILNKHGIESYVAESFKEAFSVNTDYLFISQHIDCIEIIFEYKDLDSVMRPIKYIIENIDTPD